MGQRRLTASIERLEPNLPADSWAAVYDLVLSEPLGPYESLRAYREPDHQPDAVPYDRALALTWRDVPRSSVILQAGSRPDSLEGTLQIRLSRSSDATRIHLVLDRDDFGTPDDFVLLSDLFERLALTLGGPIAASLGAAIRYPDAYRALGLRKLVPCFHLFLTWRHIVAPAAAAPWYEWSDLTSAPAHEVRHLGDLLLLETYASPFDHDTDEGRVALIRLNTWLRDKIRFT
jgi:hypothetical protein